MEQHDKVQILRDMIALAKQLRSGAATTDDGDEIGLFLRTAAALEDRANALAYGDTVDLSPVTPHAPVDMVC